VKKFIAKIALALLPIAVYLAVFIAFEPNNYFGLRKQGSTNSPIARIRAYQKDPQPNILLGDSRMAHFDMSLVDEVSGVSWANLAFGGASLEESIDEFYYIYKQYPDIERVVLGVSFYTLNANYRTANRMATVEEQLANPVAYISNLEYNINTLTVIGDKLRGLPDVEETAEHTADDYLPSGARKDLVAYAAILYQNCAKQTPSLASGYSSASAMVSAMNAGTLDGDALAAQLLAYTQADSKFRINDEALAKLLEMVEFCSQNGVELTLVFPPMDDSLRVYVCDPLGIGDAMIPALEALQNSGVRILDYEWETVPDYNDTMFYDGFHMDTRHGLAQFTQLLFTEVMNG
jgi:hypothetical protein